MDLLQYKKMTIEDYRNNEEKALHAFIDRLKNMEPVKPEDDDMHIFFAYRSEGDGDDGIGFGMVIGKELIEKGTDANTLHGLICMEGVAPMTANTATPNHY